MGDDESLINKTLFKQVLVIFTFASKVSKQSFDILMYRKCDSGSDNRISCSRWWYSPCLRRAKMGRTQTLLVVCLRFFASRYVSHRIRRRLTLLERLILRRLPIIPRICLFAHSSLPPFIIALQPLQECNRRRAHFRRLPFKMRANVYSYQKLDTC